MSVELVNLARSVYWKCKGPAAMEQQFGPLAPDKEMPEGAGAYKNVAAKLLFQIRLQGILSLLFFFCCSTDCQ